MLTALTHIITPHSSRSQTIQSPLHTTENRPLTSSLQDKWKESFSRWFVPEYLLWRRQMMMWTDVTAASGREKRSDELRSHVERSIPQTFIRRFEVGEHRHFPSLQSALLFIFTNKFFCSPTSTKRFISFVLKRNRQWTNFSCMKSDCLLSLRLNICLKRKIFFIVCKKEQWKPIVTWNKMCVRASCWSVSLPVCRIGACGEEFTIIKTRLQFTAESSLDKICHESHGENCRVTLLSLPNGTHS